MTTKASSSPSSARTADTPGTTKAPRSDSSGLSESGRQSATVILPRKGTRIDSPIVIFDRQLELELDA